MSESKPSQSPLLHDFDHDFIIVGSGFGGSVSGLRLVEKGYNVRMLEQGSEFEAEDFPKTNWDLKRWLWLPAIGFRGLFRMRLFRHVTVLAGAGVGGGSLVYANTLPIPGDGFFKNPSWAKLADWKSELSGHYPTARRMLGANQVPFLTKPDRVLKAIAKDRDREQDFASTHVGVYFGEPGKTVQDPYFDGAGPERTGCIRCGACMTGCRHNAKNTLDKNYLYLARKKGLRIDANSEVTRIETIPNTRDPESIQGYKVFVRQGRSLFGWRRKKLTFTTKQLVISGGVLGSVDLLLRQRDREKTLPDLSPTLGHRIRTNSESLIGVVSEQRDEDLSTGVAIGSILHTDQHSHLEPVRYGAGSGFYRTVMAPHVGGNLPGPVRVVKAFWDIFRQPLRSIKAYFVRDWAKSAIILLYMRSLEGTLQFQLRRGLSRLLPGRIGSQLEQGEAPTASIPEATELAQEVAKKVDGYPVSLVTETLLNIPSTAHILGGCCMGASSDDGVIDAQHRVFGYPGLYVIDGSAVSANPGVNPSLTITALAERAMSFIPMKASQTRQVASRTSDASTAHPV